jgi:chromosome segregation ATPase
MQVTRRFLVVFLFSLLGSAQAQIVFNKTEHDFGTLARVEGHFEQDFLFRNTGDETVYVLSVRSVQRELDFIYTRSEVLPGEYGFVKVKIYTDSLRGLFHDEVYVNLSHGNEIKSEVIYVRATIDEGGKLSDDRTFQDGKMATSVEVSPDDIETMEGFMGGDKLSQAQSEIDYLKKQVQLKSDLIAKLSDDLFQKKKEEQENMQRLSTLKQTIRKGGGNNSEALNQLEELTARIEAMQSSDNLLRQEIMVQEAEYDRLKHEADSARSYAEELSRKLQEQFDKEAKAMERAAKLEQDLKQKERTEQQQQERIDSLSQVLASAKDPRAVSKEIKRLREELDLKKQDQQLQAEHAERQQKKILMLREENERFKQYSDSLEALAANSSNENAALQARLNKSNNRISSYERMIDSLQVMTSQINGSEQSSLAELYRLKRELAEVEQEDAALKAQVQAKETELQRLQEERDLAKKNVEALKMATTRQQQQTHDLMYRLNDLSSKESEAQIEILDLKNALSESRAREDSSRQSVNRLVLKISEKDASIQDLSSQINAKESALKTMQAQRNETARALEAAKRDLNASSTVIDSLEQLLGNKQDNTTKLENDIAYLQKQVLASHEKEVEYESRAADLENRLKNAHLSNDLTFQELKGDIDAMRSERDRYKDLYKRSQLEIDQLERELLEAQRNEESAVAFANELQSETSKTARKRVGLVFSVHVSSSTSPLDRTKDFRGEKQVREYQENGRYHYAIGEEPSLENAIQLKEGLKSKGFSKVFVVAFLDGEHISLKEALELAQR